MKEEHRSFGDSKRLDASGKLFMVLVMHKNSIFRNAIRRCIDQREQKSAAFAFEVVGLATYRQNFTVLLDPCDKTFKTSLYLFAVSPT